MLLLIHTLLALTLLRNCFVVAQTLANGQLARRHFLPVPSPSDPREIEESISDPVHYFEKRQVARQRIEFLSWPATPNGERWVYEWSYYLSPGVASSDHFFHLFQLLSRESGGYSIALDLINGRVVVVNAIQQSCGGSCPSVPQSRFWGQTVRFRVEVKYGSGGFVNLRVTRKATGATILSYSINNVYVPGQSSMKTGLYRALPGGNVRSTSATAFVGDFSFRRV